MPPKGVRMAPRPFPHYRLGLTKGTKTHALWHKLPDGQVVTIQTTVPFTHVVIGHGDLSHKYALACRRVLRAAYREDYRRMKDFLQHTTTEESYVISREEEAYLAAYATPPSGPWRLLGWSRSQDRASVKTAAVGALIAGFWEPINHGMRRSAWPIASMAHLPEPYPVPDRFRFGYEPPDCGHL